MMSLGQAYHQSMVPARSHGLMQHGAYLGCTGLHSSMTIPRIEKKESS